MSYINRSIEAEIHGRFFSGKAIIVYGPRQSGKTTMIRHLVEPYASETLWLNGDSPDVREQLEKITVTEWRAIIGRNRIVVIDEAQRIPNVGISMKLLVDELSGIQLIATGSSAFELANRTAEPMTGRKFEYRLFPLSFSEMCAQHGLLEEKRSLEQRLLYGAYPEIISKPHDGPALLSMLAGSYLYKDLLSLESVKKPLILDKLIRALALQLGSEVSANELATLVGADNKTIVKYIDLLEKCFVVFSLPAYSGNARNEIRKSRKIYFYDLGIRNAVIGNFIRTSSRTDVGGLWENYLILERMKLKANELFPPRRYFWRTVSQKEVDYLEESASGLSAWEFKWNKDSKAKIPALFTSSYPQATTHIVTPANYSAFLCP